MANKKRDKQPEIIDVKETNTKTSQNKKQSKFKFKGSKLEEYLKDLGLSFVRSKNLFRWGVRHWITPLITFLLVAIALVLPPYLQNTSLTGEQIVQGTGVLYSNDVISHVLSTNVKCKIENSKLVCEEGYSYVETYNFTNDVNTEIEYDIFINAEDEIRTRDDNRYFEVGDYADDGDNYIAFYKETFIVRYVYRDGHGNYSIRKIYGFYNLLNGLNLSESYNDSLSLTETQKSEHFDKISNDIISLGYRSSTSEYQFIQLSSNLLSYVILLLVVALLFKGNFLLNRKKGFKYSQALKISIMASVPAYLIALVLSLFSFDLVTMFGLVLTARTLYIWFKYTSSRKNTQWLDDLYKFSRDTRFLLESETK